MSARETLDKIVNKTPLRCRLGWHKWRVVEIHPRVSVKTVREGTSVAYRWDVTQRCVRCTQEREVRA